MAWIVFHTKLALKLARPFEFGSCQCCQIGFWFLGLWMVRSPNFYCIILYFLYCIYTERKYGGLWPFLINLSNFWFKNQSYSERAYTMVRPKNNCLLFNKYSFYGMSMKCAYYLQWFCDQNNAINLHKFCIVW